MGLTNPRLDDSEKWDNCFLAALGGILAGGYYNAGDVDGVLFMAAKYANKAVKIKPELSGSGNTQGI